MIDEGYKSILVILLFIYIAVAMVEYQGIKSSINNGHPHFPPEDETRKTQEEFEKEILMKRENWTTCREFLNSTELDVMRIVDVDWKMFYACAEENLKTAVNFRFRLPTKTLVRRFSGELDDEVKGVNWTAAELFLESNTDFSALFIRSNISGLYKIVPSFLFDYRLKDPDFQIALKIVDTKYLGFMNCKYRMLFLLAAAENLPKSVEEIQTVADMFKFRSDLQGLPFLDLFSTKRRREPAHDIIERDERMEGYPDFDERKVLIF